MTLASPATAHTAHLPSKSIVQKPISKVSFSQLPSLHIASLLSFKPPSKLLHVPPPRLPSYLPPTEFHSASSKVCKPPLLSSSKKSPAHLPFTLTVLSCLLVVFASNFLN